jgi:porphobilinogen synthase
VPSYPEYRPRRLRRTEALRRAFAEVSLDPSRLIAPLFLKEGLTDPVPIASMPGQHQHSLESLVKQARELQSKGIAGVLLFGVPQDKDERGSSAYARNGIVQQGLKALKDEVSDEMVVMADLCLCEYTDHGHCGILAGTGVDNDATLAVYAEVATSQAEAGADLVAPSGMMDGQVAAVRRSLDEARFTDTGVVAYAVKYTSSFYGPFRDAAEGAPRFGDRRAYQQNPANAAEALREAALDIEEGADALLVKPAIGYLDIVSEVKKAFGYPLFAYNVSGEYSAVMAAVANGWMDERAAVLEVLTSIRRAGADLVITYHASKAAEWMS